MDLKSKIVLIYGPTASGKSNFAIKLAKKIIVIDSGKIIEEGNHKTLLERKGVYFDLYKQQLESDK